MVLQTQSGTDSDDDTAYRTPDCCVPKRSRILPVMHTGAHEREWKRRTELDCELPRGVLGHRSRHPDPRCMSYCSSRLSARILMGLNHRSTTRASSTSSPAPRSQRSSLPPSPAAATLVPGQPRLPQLHLPLNPPRQEPPRLILRPPLSHLQPRLRLRVQARPALQLVARASSCHAVTPGSGRAGLAG